VESMLFVIFALCVGLYGLVWALCGCLLGFELLAHGYSWLSGKRSKRANWQIGSIVAAVFVGFGLLWPAHRAEDLFRCLGTTLLIVGLILFFSAPLFYCVKAYRMNDSSNRTAIAIVLMPLCGVSATLMIAACLFLLVQLVISVNSIWF